MTSILDSENWDELYTILSTLMNPLIQAAGKHHKTLKSKDESINLIYSLALLISYLEARSQAPCQQDHELFQARINHNFEMLDKEINDALSNK